MKRAFLLLTLPLVGMLSFSGCTYLDGISIIGLDSQGNPTQAFLSQREYVKKTSEYITSVQDSVIPVLNRHDTKIGWMLRTLIFGVGLNAEIGIGSFKVGVNPRIRLIFSNMTDPNTP